MTGQYDDGYTERNCREVPVPEGRGEGPIVTQESDEQQ